MPAVTVPQTPIATDPGYLFYAALGTSLPANTVAGSVFTDSWPGGWTLLGVTKDGSEFDWAVTVAEIDAAEYLDPLAYRTTGRAGSIKFEMMLITATNIKRAINGGVITATGSGATQLNALTPPAAGAEIRCMIGWESTDSTERIIGEQCFQVGSLAMSRKKGSDNATLPVEFKFEVAASGLPFRYWSAGTARA